MSDRVQNGRREQVPAPGDSLECKPSTMVGRASQGPALTMRAKRTDRGNLHGRQHQRAAPAARYPQPARHLFPRAHRRRKGLGGPPTIFGVDLAGTLPLRQVLCALAQRRPVFHSEADFQLELAWQVRLAAPELSVRLETRPAPGVHLDMLLSGESGRTALELKCLTRGWSGDRADERFELKNHGAQDVRGYDVVKDIARVEQFCALAPGTNGAAICLSNDAYYWRSPAYDRLTNAGSFRLHDGTVLSGLREWRPGTGAGTNRGREQPIALVGRYELHWVDFSTVDGSAAGRFRVLVVPVPPVNRQL